MLLKPEIIAFLPTVNPKKSKQFYANILGLKLVSEDDYALVFKERETLLRITIVQELTPHPFTVLGFGVENITSQVTALSEKGIEFERYESLQQDELGIWTSPSKAKVAWFRDPDGNLLSLTQFPIT